MKKKTLSLLLLSFMILSGVLISSAIEPVQSKAASLGKPKYVKASCSYTNNKVCLTWTKVKGAKKYQIYRAKLNPKTGKNGKWTKWAASKKTYIKKKTSGDFRYRVRAIRGKKTGAWSKSIRIFAATGKIIQMSYTDNSIFGVDLGSKLNYRILISDKTKSPMGFVESGTRFGGQCSIYAKNPGNGAILKKWDGYLRATGSNIGAMQVNALKTQYLDFYAFISPSEWETYKNCIFMATNSFYPNPKVEPIKNVMAITTYNNGTASAIAGK